MVPSASSPTQGPAFGLIVPGKPLRTDFVAVDATKYALSFALDIPLQTVREIVMMKLPQFDLPSGHGVLCYWQITAQLGAETRSTGFELLGALADSQPTAIFQTGWSEHDQVAELSSSGAALQVSIGVSLESLSNIQNLGNAADKVQQGKLYVAQKVAEDLFKYMLSFDTGASGGDSVVVPKNIFDRWFQRFKTRFQRDPNFFLRNSES